MKSVKAGSYRPLQFIHTCQFVFNSELLAFEIINNKFTGKVKGVPCFREGKLDKVNEWLKSHNYNLSDATFYTDSFNDLPLLEKSGKSIVVDGDDKLTLVAKENGWECISFR